MSSNKDEVIDESFQEKLERALQRSIRKHGVKSFEPAPSESNDA